MTLIKKEKMTDSVEKAPTEKTLEKPVFNVLYIGDSGSRLSHFRGDIVLKSFATFYEKYANTSLLTALPNKLHSFSMDDLRYVNVIWLDNTVDAVGVQKINEVQVKLMDEIDPKWKETLAELKKESEEKAIEFIKELKNKRSERLRVIYALDEFVWEGPAGRSQTIQNVHLIENYLNISDTIVVPTNEMREALTIFNLVNKHIDIAVVPTAINHEFFPLFKRVEKTTIMNASFLPKPRILVKGLEIPENIQEFIMRNYKEFDITISSVGELNSHIMTLIGRKKLTHIYHWANPGSNKKNFTTTYAIERDIAYDYMVFCVPSDLNNKYYDLTMGDEDILFSIASGTLPICVTQHVEYDTNHLTNSGLVVNIDTKQEDIAKMVKSHYYDHSKFNLAFNKCKLYIENRVLSSPYMMATYFGVLLGRKKAEERKQFEESKKVEQVVTEQPEQEQTVEGT